ncbi:hypothetical protein DSO57_1022928 [Entomophthora muscae]|uniref:Uncharacterized protein n=1 Tax=Entomophthora muscae TaxID=34485 RepID=A0ACC2UC15_9FUNG|nr:hypothetical protein DSO57_1022928 [Entomophthora muscae]
MKLHILTLATIYAAPTTKKGSQASPGNDTRLFEQLVGNYSPVTQQVTFQLSKLTDKEMCIHLRSRLGRERRLCQEELYEKGDHSHVWHLVIKT